MPVVPNSDISPNCEQPSCELTLNIGLYPDVPRLEQFEETIIQEWEKKHPHIELIFQNWWDGGYKKEPVDLDLFIFDGVFLEDYITKGYLLPLKENDINDFDDLLYYAKEGVKAKHSQEYFGIPQIACRSLLFYRKDDVELQNANTLTNLSKVIGKSTFDTVLPPQGEGLMIDFSSETTNGYYYLEAIEYISKENLQGDLRVKKRNTQESCPIANISYLRQLTSIKHASNMNINRAEKFSLGYGRAYVGYSESMTSLDEKTRNEIEFKYLPFSDNDHVSHFYTDIVGIHPKVLGKKMEKYTLDLANILTSTKTFINATCATSKNPVLQYLLPVRHNTFKAMSKKYPIYSKFYNLLTGSSDVRLFKMKKGAALWLKKNKQRITKRIFEYNQKAKYSQIKQNHSLFFSFKNKHSRSTF